MINKVPVLLLAVTSIVLIYFAASFGVANLYSSAIEQTQVRWQQQNSAKAPPSSIEIENTAKLISTMLELQPHHPYYISLAASHYNWLSFISQEPNLLTHAINLESQSLTHRPTWSKSYATLAWYAWQQQPSFNEVDAYFQQANRFGPYNVYSQQAYLEIGLANWPELSPAQQIRVSDILLSQVVIWKYQANIENIFARSPATKQRACNLLRFNRIYLQACDQPL